MPRQRGTIFGKIAESHTMVAPFSTRRQLADAVLLVEPTGLRFNPETAGDNFFQRTLDDVPLSEIRKHALVEFRSLVDSLNEAGIETVVAPAPEGVEAPDAVFPNNWISCHADGTVILYPMKPPNRRVERRTEVVELIRLAGFEVCRVLDFSEWERAGQFLEGTGSLVLDHVHRLAFASLSERTDPAAVTRWCEQMEFSPIVFQARQPVGTTRRPVYHTNVALAIGESWAIVCAEAIDDEIEQCRVWDALAGSGRTVIEISSRQMVEAFAGNVLQLNSWSGVPVTVISQVAFDSLDPRQLHSLACSGRVLPLPIPTIEACGGGSVRCMLAEIFLPRSR
jgi:hypothetical protein